MIAILTADIRASARVRPEIWMEVLKYRLNQYGCSPEQWEIYRGDEFQLRVPVTQGLQAAITLKAALKSIKGLDLRLAIGIGDENYRSDRISECNGSAYQRSGRSFDHLKDASLNLHIDSGNEPLDTTLNLMFKFALSIMDHWSQASAETVLLVLEKPQMGQVALAAELNIQQSAFSQRLKRAHMDLIWELLTFYQTYYLPRIQ